MVRVGNLRAQSMVEAEFRVMFMRDEPVLEGDPRRSSPELGKIFLDWKVKHAVAEIRKLIANSTVKQ